MTLARRMIVPAERLVIMATLRSFLAREAMPPMAPNIPDDRQGEDRDDQHVEAVENLAQGRIGLPTPAELRADIGEREAPRPGAEEGIDLEFELRHAGDAGRKRNKGAHHGEEPADEHGDAAETVEEAVD